ncbi:hypothetical protein J3E64_000165 [Sphingobium sp. OAS761]|uniref:hypothetical protein n=1 Tax=Sphingobium sp. OAS761 TaxID=2817901 RepID=UPI00209D05B2|nr:hypothetical protein [Sphingobium sp. OAS761]MCP1468498.1 hypothetical protein [Sphingobium sp. OAS761]
MSQRLNRVEARLSRLETMAADSISRLDRLQHLVELVLGELHVRRREHDATAHDPARWSPGGFPLLPRNRPVQFGIDREEEGLAPDDFLASGWYARENWGVWGRDAVQAIRFSAADYHGGYLDLQLTLRSFVPPGGSLPDVDISANGYFLGSHRIGNAARVYRLRLPPSCVGDGDILIQLRHDSPQIPAKGDVLRDNRILGIGLVALSVSG